MKEMMIDIETLGLKPGCIVVEIAFVMFDLKTGLCAFPNTYLLSIREQRVMGLTSDDETWDWWQKRGGLPTGALASPIDVLGILGQFYEEHQPQRIWARGADFDFPILRALFEAYLLECPWPYYQQCDQRTLTQLAQSTSPSHRALADCHRQIRHLSCALADLQS